jgi:hypothetical protein
MATLQRLEVWTDLQCAGGSRVAILPVDHCTRLATTTRTTREDTGTIELSKDAAAYAYVADGYVIRWLFDDASFDEWRIVDIEDASRSARTATLTLASPLMDLAKTSAILSSTTAGVATVVLEYKALTPSSVLTNILTFCPAHWAAGTVTPTIPVDLTPSGWMPLRALRELVSAIRAQGVSCELDFRRNGTTGYYIDLVTTIGASAAAVDVRTAKNLLATTRRSTREPYAQEVVPLGATSPVTGATSTIARAWWECTAKSGSDVTMAQPSTGGQMVAFDDQYNGLYLIDDAGARQSITDTVQSTQTLTIASVANVTVGRWYRVALNSSGDELIRIRKAEATAGLTVPVTSSVLTDTTNHIDNPAMRDWAGASSDPPDGYTKYSTPTLTRTTTSGLWYYGGKSCRFQSTGSNQGLGTAIMSIYVPTWATTVQYSAWIYVTTIGTGNVSFQWFRDGASLTSTAVPSTTGAWQRVDYSSSMSGLTGAVRSFQVRIWQINAGTGFDGYFDSAQVTFTSSAQAFTEGSQPARLWALGNRHLTVYGTTPVSYTIQFADLASWDAAAFPYDTVTLGATANMRDTDLNVTVAARIVELTRNWRALLASSITVSTRPTDLVSTLTGIADL